jgi:hypothetical protein
MVNQILLGLVQSVLGRSTPTARGNHSFSCPFCNHKNPKLEVNLIPNKKTRTFGTAGFAMQKVKLYLVYLNV